LLSFAVSYGLALQGLNKSKLSTNLLPGEIVTERVIRDKKPWAVAMAAAILLGCTINFFGHWQAWASVHPDRFKGEIAEADRVESEAQTHNQNFTTAAGKFKKVNMTGENIVGNVDGRLMWLEVLTAIGESLPHDEPGKRPEDIMDRNELHIDELECEYFPDLAAWFQGVQHLYSEQQASRAPKTAYQQIQWLTAYQRPLRLRPTQPWLNRVPQRPL